MKTFPLPVHVIALLAFALSRPAPAQDRHVLVPVAELEQMLGSEPLRIVSAEIRWRSRRWWDSSQEELKHQEMFRRIERMIGARMPEGYHFVPNPDEVAKAVLGASTWAVLALTCHIELFVQAHYVESIQPDSSVSPLYKDVFLFHWKDESQHTMLDELEWTRVDRRLTLAERDRAVDDFIALVGSVDGILQAQAAADVSYFQKIAEGRFDAAQVAQLGDLVLRAYRWQYIVSGAQHPRFAALGHDGSAPGSA